MKILEQLAEAVNTVDEIKNKILDLVWEQNKIEKRAYQDVYGLFLDLDLDKDKCDYHNITDDGVVEAWRYGHWGGEDWIDWSRPLDPLMDMESPKSLEDLYSKFVAEYTSEKEAEEERVSKLNQKRRATLLAELQGLDKE
jgi:hypothetical protein